MFCRQSTMPWCLKFIPISCMGPNMHPRTKIWFFNQFICTGACAYSSTLNYAHKCIENSVNAQKCPNEPRKIKKITQHSCCSMLTREIFLKAIRGNGYRFVPKGGTYPTENHHACCEKLRFVRSIYPNRPKWDNVCTTASWCRSMIACQVSWISDKFWIYKNLKTSHLNVLPAINSALVFEIHSLFLYAT